MTEERVPYQSNFIIEARRVSFEAGGRRYWMRQPTPEEAADGDSAYRLAYQRVLDDKRLVSLAGDEKAIEREARIRAAASEALYLIPLLLEDEDGAAAFDVFDPDSMAEFETLPPEVITRMTEVFWGPIQDAMLDAKKKA